MTTRAPIQDGSGLFIADTWEEGSATLYTISESTPFRRDLGLVFDFGLRFDSNGLAVDIPVISDLAVVLTYDGAVDGNRGDDILELWVVPETTPANFTDGATSIPFKRNEVLIGAADAIYAGGGPVTVTLTAGVYRTSGDAQTPDALDTWTRIRGAVMSNQAWNWHLALSIKGTANPAIVWTFFSLESGGTAASLVTTETPFFSGLIGGPTGPRQRFVRDQRFGMPALNTELVQDGVIGMWVRPEDADPEDLPATYHPKPGEGSVDDKIPSI